MLTVQLIFVVSITMRSALFPLSMPELLCDLNGGRLLLSSPSTLIIRFKEDQIHSSRQLESFANDINNRSIHTPGGLQRIKTDVYVFPLSVRDGLP